MTNQNISFFVFILLGLILSSSMVFAQADGSLPSSDASIPPTPEKPVIVEEPAPPIASPSPQVETQDAVPTSTSSEVVPPVLPSVPFAPKPLPVSAPIPAPSLTPEEQIQPVPSMEATATPASSPAEAMPTPWAILLIVTVPFVGYGIAILLKKRKNGDTEDCSRCLELQELLEKKWKELTDIRGRIEGKLKERAREELREAVKGTATGDALILLEKTEKAYNKIKKLFEECMVDFARNAFRGVIIENGLRDAKILKKVNIEQTIEGKEQTIHHALVGKKLVSEFSKHLSSGPWFAYFWKPGKTETQVVFKEKTFTVDSRDASTWVDAVAYGKSIGIPEDRLHFSPQKS